MKKEIVISKPFAKNFKKRYESKPNVRKKFKSHLDLFIEGERGSPLNDHPLTGGMHGKRAFSVGGDVRVVYIERANDYLFLDIGSHTQVY